MAKKNSEKCRNMENGNRVGGKTKRVPEFLVARHLILVRPSTLGYNRYLELRAVG